MEFNYLVERTRMLNSLGRRKGRCEGVPCEVCFLHLATSDHRNCTWFEGENPLEAIAEIEYYAGFSGKTASIQAITEACELAVEDMRKQTPMKPIDNEELWQFECPTCGEVVVLYHDGKPHHCECGQAIDWEGIE